jgi:hypothetical protein
VKAGGTATMLGSMVSVVNHDVPTDPVKQRKRLIADADAGVKSAELKIVKQKQHLATAGKDKKDQQRAHLEGAQKALAQAIAARKELG